MPPPKRNKFNRNENSSLDVRQRGDRLIPLVMTEHGAMGAYFKAYLNELATLAVNRPGGIPTMRGTFAVSKYVAKAMLIRRWNARLVWGMQRQAASQILWLLGVPMMLSFVLVRVPAEARLSACFVCLWSCPP